MTPLNASDTDARWRFDNTYTQLPALFFERVSPTPVRAPQMAVFNHALAAQLGLDAEVLSRPEGAQLFAGNRLPNGSEPLAQAYAGHQFGHFTMLGDGRAILLGEHVAPDGTRVDIQLKGPGQTPFSRRGDGRAALGPMLREYIISEAMFALGVPTTRSLAVVETGEPVFRETTLPGAILTRVAASHLRVGTFEYAAGRRNPEALKALADYAIARHYPTLAKSEAPYLGLLDAVMERQAALVAKWLCVGFIHGVMNTDNMSIAGETIDYGPCAFMDVYEPSTVFSSIDHHGRYAYGNQPPIAQWNLLRLAEALLPLLHAQQELAVERAREAISRFPAVFEAQWLSGMRRKLGLFTEEEGDRHLVEGLLESMQRSELDFTLTFRALSSERPPEGDAFQLQSFVDWHADWQTRLSRQPQSREAVVSLMRASNPAVIPRNHKVEEALSAASERGDLTVLRRLLDALKRPYEDVPENEDYRSPPPASARHYQTFCGT